MQRFFGMMPVSEISIEKHYKNGVTIQAGNKGWTILFKDHSSEYEDCEDTDSNNFIKAYNKVVGYFGEEEL